MLEQIVGEIEDEYDVDDDIYIMKYSDSQYSVKALTPVEEFNKYFHAAFSDEEFDTVGGLVLNAFGRLPQRGERVRIGPFEFEVVRADKRRLYLLRLSLVDEAAEAEQGETS